MKVRLFVMHQRLLAMTAYTFIIIILLKTVCSLCQHGAYEHITDKLTILLLNILEGKGSMHQPVLDSSVMSWPPLASVKQA